MREKHAEFRVTASTRSGGALPGTGRSRRLLAVDHPRRRELEDISRLLATGRCSTDDLERFGRQAHCFRHLGIVEELLSHIGIAGDDGSFDSRSIPIGTPVTSAANSRGRGGVKHRPGHALRAADREKSVADCAGDIREPGGSKHGGHLVVELRVHLCVSPVRDQTLVSGISAYETKMAG